MATKIFCDGCDDEVKEPHRLSVSIKQNGHVSAHGGEYELCDSCFADIVDRANPARWARRPKAGPAPRVASGF
jgi:hypothetical protein